MSKVGQWVMEMQEDAAWMPKPAFVRKHGVTQQDVWEQVQKEMNGEFPYEPDPEQFAYS